MSKAISEQHYTITPLKWEKNSNAQEGDTFSAWTPFGSYRVESPEYQTWINERSSPGRWSYCFDEYYNEASHECGTSKEGKAAAERHWREYIAGALTALPAPAVPKGEEAGK